MEERRQRGTIWKMWVRELKEGSEKSGKQIKKCVLVSLIGKNERNRWYRELEKWRKRGGKKDEVIVSWGIFFSLPLSWSAIDLISYQQYEGSRRKDEWWGKVVSKAGKVLSEERKRKKRFCSVEEKLMRVRIFSFFSSFVPSASLFSES